MVFGGVGSVQTSLNCMDVQKSLLLASLGFSLEGPTRE